MYFQMVNQLLVLTNMSSIRNNSKKSYEECVEEYFKFIVDRLNKVGKLPVQHLTGHLSMLDLQVRDAIGCSKADLTKFLRQYPNCFIVDNDSATVSLKEQNGKINFADVQSAKKDSSNAASQQKHTIKKRTRVENGRFDADHYEGEGTIQNIFDKYGFIAVEGNQKNTAFFHAHTISNYTNITNLHEILKIGDVVEFSAVRSTKKETVARWEATQVMLNNGAKISRSIVSPTSTATKTNGSDDEIFMSSSGSSVIQSDCEDGDTEKACKVFPKSVTTKGVNYSLENIVTHEGKIYPRNDKRAVIKFGKENKLLANADSCSFYVYGKEVEDVVWEFNEGDRVTFDAIQTDTVPGWKAVLVWVGRKPDVSNSEVFSKFLKAENNSNIKDNSSRVNSDVSDSKFKKIEKLNLQKGPESLEDRKIKPPENRILNWGDTPFPDEASVTSENKCVTSKKNFVDLGIIKKSSNDNLVKHRAATIVDVEYMHDNKKKSFVGSSGSPKQKYSSRKEDTFSPENERRKTLSTADKNIELPSSSFSHPLVNEKKSDNKVEIKVFKNMHGKIATLLNTFGDINCNTFNKPLLFYMKDAYYDGVSVCEEYESLNAKFKVGDGIKFNCFEKINSKEDSEVKVTLVWKGDKPKQYREKSLQEFISESDDAATVDQKYIKYISENSEDELKCDNSKICDISLKNKNDCLQAIDSQKKMEENNVLNIEEESMRHLNCTENTFKSRFLTEEQPSSSSLISEQEKFEATCTVNSENSVNACSLNCVNEVSDMLYSLLPSLSHASQFNEENIKDHIKNVSSEIVQLVMSDLQSSHPNTLNKFEKTRKQDLRYSEQTASKCSVGVQTFITGEVSSSSIFPH